MYDVNVEEINRRLDFMRVICDTAERTRSANPVRVSDGILQFAEQRAVHLAAECVTDVGSYMIDGFIMRDAGSYEDIVDILFDERVFGSELYAFLQALVRQRKPLVQEYDRLDLAEISRLAGSLPEELPRFSEAVRRYLDHELGK